MASTGAEQPWAGSVLVTSPEASRRQGTQEAEKKPWWEGGTRRGGPPVWQVPGTTARPNGTRGCEVAFMLLLAACRARSQTGQQQPQWTWGKEGGSSLAGPPGQGQRKSSPEDPGLSSSIWPEQGTRARERSIPELGALQSRDFGGQGPLPSPVQTVGARPRVTSVLQGQRVPSMWGPRLLALLGAVFLRGALWCLGSPEVSGVPWAWGHGPQPCSVPSAGCTTL